MIENPLKAMAYSILGIFVILLLFVLFGCAAAPLTYEQRLVLASVGAGLQEAGNRTQRVYVDQPLYVPYQPPAPVVYNPPTFNNTLIPVGR